MSLAFHFHLMPVSHEMISAESAINRFRRDLTVSTLLKGVLVCSALAALVIGPFIGGMLDGSLVLLVVGIVRKIKVARYAALGLLGVTLVKLFFHDLANLKQLYRIGALIGVAVIAILASFLYQRFIAMVSKSDEASATK